MDEHLLGYSKQVAQEDWERTPASVKQLVEEMTQRLGQLEKKLAELQAEQQLLKEKTKRTSSNSSLAPSLDPPGAAKSKRKRKSGKKRKGQPGHEGHSRPLYPVEQCTSVTDYYPPSYGCCGEKLKGEDANPYRHTRGCLCRETRQRNSLQIVEIPPISPQVAEYRLHQLVCAQCGSATRAELPADVSPSGYGPRVVGTVALLSGLYRHSQRMVLSAMADLFGVSMSLGSVNNLRQEASCAVAKAVEETQQYVQQQPVVGADGTSWTQGNADGANERGTKVAAGSSDAIGHVFSGDSESLHRGSPNPIRGEVWRHPHRTTDMEPTTG